MERLCKGIILASTVMLGLTAISVAASVTLQLGILIGLSAITGVVTIICTVAWHAKEYKMQIQKKPALLLIASYSFGFQTGFFIKTDSGSERNRKGAADADEGNGADRRTHCMHRDKIGGG